MSLATSSTTSSLSSSTVFSTYGIRRALNATIPASTDGPSKKQLKDVNYRHYVTDRHNALLAELDAAREAFDAITEERDLNESTNLRKSMRLNRMVVEANMRLNKAEREYEFYVDEIEELRQGTKMSRDEAEEWNYFSLLLKQRFDENDEAGLLDALSARMRKAGRA